MGIRNISFLPFVLSVLFFSLLGCQTNPFKSTDTSEEPTDVSKPPPKLEIPDFAGKRAPRVGVILGPGGAKTFAHVGVLQEMEQQKIPIVAVAGLEWGALAGGLFALNGEVHEMDWKLSQIPKMNFSTKNFFSRKMQALRAKDFDSYLNKVFAGARLERMKIPFGCPYISGAIGKVRLAKKGSAKGYVKACWQYPPIFPVNQVMGAPFALGKAVKFLRSRGAELIVLVDVLGRAHRKDFQAWADNKWSWFAWTPVQEALSKSPYAGVHEIVRVDTTSYSMIDVEQRLRLIQLGRQESSASIETIVEKYDF